MHPEIECIMQEALARMKDVVRKDTKRDMFPELLTFEEQSNQIVKELGRQMVQGFVDIRKEQSKQTHVVCEKCGGEMEWHAETQWKHGSMHGDVQVKDPYAYCRTCAQGARPIHEWIGTERERWSLWVQEAAMDLATDESCEKAVKKLERHHPGVQMNRTTALKMLHRHGEQAREFVAEKIAKALSEAAQEGCTHKAPVVLEVEYDGGMIPVATLEKIEWAPGTSPELTPVRRREKRRKRCRWEEVKVGLVQTPGEVTGRLYTVRSTAELDAAFEDLLGLACMKGWTENAEVRGIADGARYIRTRMQETFHASTFQFILDRPHAKSHLSNAGEHIESVTGQPKATWTEEALNKIEAGQVDTIVSDIRQGYDKTQDDELRKEANYFERNRDAVAYADYRSKGWSVASSEVESSHRHIVQTRLKIPGAWWHPDKVPNILALRMLKANEWWDEYWLRCRQKWREHAKEFCKKEHSA